jgi:hypothetical protein
MSDVLVRIKRTVLAGRYAFSEKARLEMEKAIDDRRRKRSRVVRPNLLENNFL